MQPRWLDHYDPDVPPTLAPYPDRTLLDCLDEIVNKQPRHPLVLFKGATLTAEGLQQRSQAMAAALVEAGVEPGARVALLLPNTPQFLIAQFGIWKAGAIAVPLNPLYSERELQEALTATGATAVVTLTPFYTRVKAVQARTAVRLVIATSIKEYLPPMLRVLFVLFKERKDGHHIRLQTGDVWLRDLLRRYQDAPAPNRPVGPDDPAVVLSSGGTTGTPKGVLGRHRDYVIAGIQLHAWTRSARMDWLDTVMLPLPLFHVYANVGVQGLAFIGRNPLSLVPNPRDIPDLLDTIAKVRPGCFNGVPALYTAILNHPRVQKGEIDLSSIKLCVCGSAPLMAETKRRFEEATGARIVEGYSLTEAMMACLVNPVRGTQKVGSIGVPLPDVEVLVVDTDTGDRELPAGDPGELLLRAPQLMQGYWNNPGETATALRVHGNGGPWLHTGDLAYQDEDGFVFIVDRTKDMIKTSGFQVWPREIEEVVAAHPAVMEVGVAGVPHATKGEAARAWVVLRDGHTATAEELRAWCLERLAPYKVPAEFEFRSSLPKTIVGKVLRRALTSEHTGS
ncbi:MAG: long-chain fatty acid--CoA ligase [Acidimicrobiia bacterium]|nr:long-chain fatty acid--CoA ligase [Acidimicrobiia bacterium]